ncbi:MAG: TIGR01620 family protein [Ancalomicrobiaceae bacterium]|nr:TIGR01620 family protein [Ancalomicrobiaceae bacterium]
MTPAKPRPPAAFRLGSDDVLISHDRNGHLPAVQEGRTTVVIEPEPEPPAELPPRPAVRRRNLWKPLLGLSLVGLVGLEIGLSVDRLIEDLSGRASWLGWLGGALAAVGAGALVALTVDEIGAMSRMRRIDRLRAEAEAAAAADDGRAARRIVADLRRLYADRPETARARGLLAEASRDIVDGRDLLVLAERDLIGPIELQAKAAIFDSARRVTLMTAISPRALVDILFVLYETIRLLRRLSGLYGGRPGTLQFLKLTGRVLAQLGITGGMALGDGLAQQILGQGIVGRLSARLGEGVVNGLLTARFGLAAIDLIRPLPRLKLDKPSLTDVLGELTKIGQDKGKDRGKGEPG